MIHEAKRIAEWYAHVCEGNRIISVISWCGPMKMFAEELWKRPSVALVCFLSYPAGLVDSPSGVC
jgi:hypothetical protein